VWCTKHPSGQEKNTENKYTYNRGSAGFCDCSKCRCCHSKVESDIKHRSLHRNYSAHNDGTASIDATKCRSEKTSINLSRTSSQTFYTSDLRYRANARSFFAQRFAVHSLIIHHSVRRSSKPTRFTIILLTVHSSYARNAATN